MENKNIGFVYRSKWKRKVKQYNHMRALPEYFGPLIGDKNEVTIAELGAGPINTIGDIWPGVRIKLYCSDILAKDYEEFWEEKGVKLIRVIEYQDMEHLTYSDNIFDIVHCRNALDHTPDPYKAIKEMQRVCKPGGWIYMEHAPSQKKLFGGHHYHNYEELDIPDYFITCRDGDNYVTIWRKPISQ